MIDTHTKHTIKGNNYMIDTPYYFLSLWYGLVWVFIILLSLFMVWFGMGVYHIIISLYGMVWYGCLSHNYLPLWYGLVWVFII
jgi:hypothetical protein